MKTLGAIESFTGGLFSSTVVSVANASTFFRGSVVTYHNEIKSQLNIETSKGVINASTALKMALQGQKFLKCDVCVAFTGNAGPAIIENQPKGLVYIAINKKVHQLQLSGNRNQIRKSAVYFAIQKIKKDFPILEAIGLYEDQQKK